MIGASAVIYVDGTETDSIRYQLGSAHEHTTLEGELVGIILGIQLANAHPRLRESINLSTDSQASIKALQSNSKQPAQYLLDEIHKSTKTLHSNELERARRHLSPHQRADLTVHVTLDISFTWVAAHKNSTGNERADKLAREAAEYDSSPIDRIPAFLRCQLPNQHHGCQEDNQQRHQKTSKTWWTSSPRFAKTKTVDPSLPSDNFIEISNPLNRRQTSLLTQLRTGHVPLNGHLHKLQRSPSPNCPQASCAGATEDTHHLLFSCPRYTHARHHLRRSIGKSEFTISSLLSKKKIITHTLTYLNAIGRFKNIFGDIAPDKES
jgi:ribonuclease HI